MKTLPTLLLVLLMGCGSKEIGLNKKTTSDLPKLPEEFVDSRNVTVENLSKGKSGWTMKVGIWVEEDNTCWIDLHKALWSMDNEDRKALSEYVVITRNKEGGLEMDIYGNKDKFIKGYGHPNDSVPILKIRPVR